MDVEFRAVVHYHWLLQTPAKEIHESMQRAYGTQCPSPAFVYKWLKEFDKGREDLTDLQRSGRPPKSDKIGVVAEYLAEFPFASARAIATAIGVDKNTVIKILTDDLHLVKKFASWVPRILTAEMKCARVECSVELRNALLGLSPGQLKLAITCDESWFFLNYSQESAWLPEGARLTKPKRLISDQKVMFFTAFSIAGPVLLEMLPSRTTFDSDFMCDTILPRLQRSALNLPGVRRTSKIRLHFDNAKPHVSKKTTMKMEELRLGRLPHPAYSPDISPNDFFLYGYMKSRLVGRTHPDSSALFASIKEIFFDIQKSTWERVFMEWIDRLNRVIDCGGEYI